MRCKRWLQTQGNDAQHDFKHKSLNKNRSKTRWNNKNYKLLKSHVYDVKLNNKNKLQTTFLCSLECFIQHGTNLHIICSRDLMPYKTDSTSRVISNILV